MRRSPVALGMPENNKHHGSVCCVSEEEARSELCNLHRHPSSAVSLQVHRGERRGRSQQAPVECRSALFEDDIPLCYQRLGFETRCRRLQVHDQTAGISACGGQKTIPLVERLTREVHLRDQTIDRS
jgi:hypothetical protein